MKDSHHLFSMPEIRNRLTEIFDEPNTDEEKRVLREETRKVHKAMPVYKIDREKHELIHKRFQMQERIKTLMRTFT